MKPFKIWLEYLDPIHKTCWAPVDMACRHIFAEYDLSQPIPCPHTKEKAPSDKAYECRRTNPGIRDYIINQDIIGAKTDPETIPHPTLLPLLQPQPKQLLTHKIIKCIK